MRVSYTFSRTCSSSTFTSCSRFCHSSSCSSAFYLNSFSSCFLSFCARLISSFSSSSFEFVRSMGMGVFGFAFWFFPLTACSSLRMRMLVWTRLSCFSISSFSRYWWIWYISLYSCLVYFSCWVSSWIWGSKSPSRLMASIAWTWSCSIRTNAFSSSWSSCRRCSLIFLLSSRARILSMLYDSDSCFLRSFISF